MWVGLKRMHRDLQLLWKIPGGAQIGEYWKLLHVYTTVSFARRIQRCVLHLLYVLHAHKWMFCI